MKLLLDIAATERWNDVAEAHLVKQFWVFCGNSWRLSADEYVRNDQKQPSRGISKKRCSENMQQTYRRTPIPKCDFNKVAKEYIDIICVNIMKVSVSRQFDIKLNMTRLISEYLAWKKILKKATIRRWKIKM